MRKVTQPRRSCQGAQCGMARMSIEASTGTQLGVPIFYFTQLLGLAMGLDPQQLSLDKLIVDPFPLLAEKGLVAGGVHL